MIGFGVSDDICFDSDEFDVPQIRLVADFVKATYQGARNKKNASGNHGLIASHVSQTQGWVVYLHEQMEAIQCPNLFQACYPQLSEGNKRTPKNNLPLSHSKGRSRSTSPKVSKRDEQAAMLAASQAIQDSREVTLRMTKMEQLRKCMNGKHAASENMDKYLEKYRSLPKGDSSTVN